ncbi:MAG: phosphoserine phosphatase SerB [Candidatus Nezhaarchaeota archaeon]|nr:phosphoserine phosphatase SerB [Candidatus Nezhaarchaeota archaeon]
MSKRLIVTVVGYDRPGIVAGITSAVAEMNGNITSIKASTLSELFVMNMIVDISKISGTEDEFVKKLKERALQIGVGIAIEDEEEIPKAKKLIAFDMDGTILEVEAIDEIAKHANVQSEVAELTRRAMHGEIDFSTALRERVKLLKGLPVKVIEDVAERLPISKGAREVIETLKNMGFITVLITGGFDIVAKKIAEKLGFDYWFANRLGVEDGKLNGKVEVIVSGGEAKLKILEEVARAHGIDLEECIAVGDGANDLLVLENVGLGIGFRPKPIVQQRVKALINMDDMRAILALIARGRPKEDEKG